MKINDSEIEFRNFAVVEDIVFLDEDELNSYLDTCRAEYSTSNFIPNVYSMMVDYGISEEEMMEDYESESDYWKDVEKFNNNVKELLKKYDIKYIHINRFVYHLVGTYSNLKKFSKEYDSHLDWMNPGEALADCAEKCDIDIESGEQSFIIGRLSK